MLNVFFFVICLMGASLSFGMEEQKDKKTITVNLEDKCSFCLDSLSVRKGSIVTLYCGHSLHALCYVGWRKSSNVCYCKAPIVDFDEEGKECLESYRNQNTPSCLERMLSLSGYCKDLSIDVVKHICWLIHDTYSSAYNYDEYL